MEKCGFTPPASVSGRPAVARPPIDELRSALRLPAEVDEERVISEAALRIERLPHVADDARETIAELQQQIVRLEATIADLQAQLAARPAAPANKRK